MKEKIKMTGKPTRIFLTAEWRKWQGDYYASLVGFMFDKVKLKGVAVPFHRRFAEVNLRFYVRYKETGNWKRGVVFVSEIVPKRAIALVANTIYKERYAVCRMRNHVLDCDGEITVGYQWKKKTWNKIEVIADSKPVPGASALGYLYGKEIYDRM